jgi:hypothetical protein
MQSESLTLIMKHWIGALPKKGTSTEFPFDLENFCRECDALLALIPRERPKYYAKYQNLPGSLNFAWAIYEGTEDVGLHGKEPIAWFRNNDDANRFIFGGG